MTRLAYVMLILLAALLTACNAVPGPSAGSSAQSGTSPAAASSTGRATVVGRVLDSKTGAALTNTSVRLAEVYRSGGEGAYVLDGGRSPGAMTDAQGNFVFQNIEPREYVMVVAPTEDVVNNIVIADESGKARVLNAESGKVLDVGVVSVDIAAAAAGS